MEHAKGMEAIQQRLRRVPVKLRRPFDWRSQTDVRRLAGMERRGQTLGKSRRDFRTPRRHVRNHDGRSAAGVAHAK